MAARVSEAVEDYLKALYALTRGGERAATGALAERMGVAPASATAMLQRLAAADPPLVEYTRHHGAALTPAGERAALQVIRHHRLLETYLQQTLGYTWDEVHPEADRLEHVISEEMGERIARALGDPTVDPHGEPIPDRAYEMPADSGATRLRDLAAGAEAVVTRVDPSDAALLRRLGALGLTPGARVRVLEVQPVDGVMRLRVRGRTEEVALGEAVTGQVYVAEG